MGDGGHPGEDRRGGGEGRRARDDREGCPSLPDALHEERRGASSGGRCCDPRRHAAGGLRRRHAARPGLHLLERRAGHGYAQGVHLRRGGARHSHNRKGHDRQQRNRFLRPSDMGQANPSSASEDGHLPALQGYPLRRRHVQGQPAVDDVAALLREHHRLAHPHRGRAADDQLGRHRLRRRATTAWCCARSETSGGGTCPW